LEAPFLQDDFFQVVFDHADISFSEKAGRLS
jgi:hypothetical protein